MAQRKRGAKGAKNTMPPKNEKEEANEAVNNKEEEEKEMKDMEGCPCGKKKCKGGCAKAMKDGQYGKSMKDGSCGKSMKDGAGGKPMKDGACGMTKGRKDALTAQEYLAACDMGIQDRARTYIRARLDTADRLDLKCGKGAISQGEKCNKGSASKLDPNAAAAKNVANKVKSSGGMLQVSQYNQKTGSLKPTSNKGPSVLTQAGQAAKGAGLGVLEAGKWLSGYNIGKTLASGITQGKNEKASAGAKTAAVVGSTLLSGLSGGAGAARRVGAFGMTDLQQNTKNQKKEKAWRKSVGYKDSIYAAGFSLDVASL